MHLTITVAPEGAHSAGSAPAVTISAVADAGGGWACMLPAMPASSVARYSLTAAVDDGTVGNKEVLTNVVWGDVSARQ